MQAMIDELAKQAEAALSQVSSKETLATFWQEYLSKNGKIPALMKNLRSVAPEERPAMGKIINELKQKVQADYDAAAEKVKQAELAARNAAETVDITLPAKTRTVGDLQGALNTFVQKLFGKDTRTRLRPSYFPFTEPSVEVDVSCFECGGKGCPLCKHTGWIEVLGGGVVNRKVLENCNIDPDEYSGFAFGIGIERIAMLKYGINNIGLMFENNLQFLKQFHE